MQNKTKAKLILALIFLCLVLNPVAGASSYDLFFLPSKYVANNGETIALKVGISGNGPIKEGKFLFYSDNSGEKKTEATLLSVNNCNNLENNAVASLLTEDSLKKLTSPSPLASDEYDVFVSEVELSGNTGLTSLCIKPQTSGDKVIQCIFTYSEDGQNWQTVSKEFHFHVNTLSEQHQDLLNLLYLIVGVVTIVVAVLAVEKIPSWLKKRSSAKDHRNK